MLALCVMVFIFWHSSQDAVASTGESSSFAKRLFALLNPDFLNLDEEVQKAIISNAQFIIRKSAHICIYALLGFFVFATACTYPLAKRYKIICSEALCVLYAVSDEIHQMFVPGRAGRLYDVIIDSCGALLGIGVLVFIIFIYRKFTKKRRSFGEEKRTHTENRTAY
jgi:VanZ family protein